MTVRLHASPIRAALSTVLREDRRASTNPVRRRSPTIGTRSTTLGPPRATDQVLRHTSTLLSLQRRRAGATQSTGHLAVIAKTRRLARRQTGCLLHHARTSWSQIALIYAMVGAHRGQIAPQLPRIDRRVGARSP
jgi:hypothetical protein